MAKVKTEKVLKKSDLTEDGFIRFDFKFDDPGAPLLMRVAMAEKEWKEFGSPEKITITVHPGDKLNK